MKLIDKAVPDTSVIVEGVISKQVSLKKISLKKIIFHEAVLAELESQANKNRETGFLGLKEIENIRKLAKKFRFEVEFKGMRPGDFEIKFAKAGEIDSLIRDLAFKEKGTLITADIVQSKVAEAKGIKVFLYRFSKAEKKMVLEKFFDKNTMSVHIRENCKVQAKKGAPGKWRYVDVTKKKLSREDVRSMAKNIIEVVQSRNDSFIEVQRKGSTIVQAGHFRIVIVRPPFSDGYEITAVKQVKQLAFKDYKLDDSLKKRILGMAEGILVAGAPGHGKSTFVQSLALEYLKMDKNVKTVETPRDMVVPDEITQYSLSMGSINEVNDILLLSRPDFTIFDEIRTTEDFKMFSDMRLSGIGMLGVVHAAKPIDSIQRFVRRIELGMIPHIIDTVVFVRNGMVDKVYSVSIEVKVPSGMTESDLARPIVNVHDFSTGKLEYEIYSYGDETIVIPVVASKHKGLFDLAEKQLHRVFEKFDRNAIVDVVSDNKCIVFVSKEAIPELIGKRGERIGALEKKLGLKIDVQERSPDKVGRMEKEIVRFRLDRTKKDLVFQLDKEFADRSVDIYVQDDFLMSVRASKKALVKISASNAMGKIISNALDKGNKLVLVR